MEQQQIFHEYRPEEDKHRIFSARLSLGVSFILLLAKFWAYNVTHSQSILSDALESIINVVGAALLIFVVRYSAMPADRDHPYGHGKAEYFSAAFEGGLISFAGVYILLEAIRAFIGKEVLHELTFGTYVVAIAGVINLLLGLYMKKVGHSKRSMALVANGQHLMSDFWTSFGLVVGLITVKLTGYYQLDSILASIVGLLLLKSGVDLVKSSAEALMDKENIDDLKRLVEIFNQTVSHKIIQIHHAKIIRSGRYHHIDAHLVVPEFWTVDTVHENIVAFENQVLAKYDYSGELNFHLDPCRRAYCKFCDIENCPIREQAFKEKMLVKLDHIRSPEEPEEFLGK